MRNSKKNRDDSLISAITFSPSLTYNFHIEFNDDREIIAEGCLGVMACSENQIKLNMGSRSFMITGSELIIASMFGQTVCIRGRIISAEFI